MVREVAPDEVRSKLDADEDVTVVDIRSPEDYEQGHVPGAVNVPLPELPQRVDEREWDAEEIVCVCPIGKSSIQAARLLGSYEEIDADAVASLHGGYRDWDGDLESGGSTDSGHRGNATDEGPDVANDGHEATDEGSGATDEGSGATDEGPDATDEGPEAPF